MKSDTEIKQARSYIVRQLLNPLLSRDQRTLLEGMSTALQWASDSGGSCLQRLLDGEPIEIRPAPTTKEE